MTETPKCECGGTIVGSGGMQDYGGTHEGYVWGGNCQRCGRGYGENVDEMPHDGPTAIFDEAMRQVRAGAWGNGARLNGVECAAVAETFEEMVNEREDAASEPVAAPTSGTPTELGAINNALVQLQHIADTWDMTNELRATFNEGLGRARNEFEAMMMGRRK